MKRKDIPKDLLEKYLDEEKTIKELTEIFDCSEKTIRNYTKEYGLVNKRKNVLLIHRDNIKVDDIRRLVENEKKTIGEVAKLYGVDKDAMSKYCLDHKIKYRRHLRFDTSGFNIDHIQSMIDNNVRIIDIANHYGCKSRTMTRWCRKNIKDFEKYINNRLYFVNPDEIRKLLNNKIKKGEIAKKYNCHPATIHRFCNRHEIDHRRLLHVQYRLNAKNIIELFNDGFGVSYIAEYYRCSPNTIRRFCENNNIDYTTYEHRTTKDKTKMTPPSIRDIIPFDVGNIDSEKYKQYKSKIR